MIGVYQKVIIPTDMLGNKTIPDPFTVKACSIHEKPLLDHLYSPFNLRELLWTTEN